MDVTLGPSAAKVKVIADLVWDEALALYQGRLKLPHDVPIKVYAAPSKAETPSKSEAVAQASMDKNGECIFGQGAGLFVGSKYFVAVSNFAPLEEASAPFEVSSGQTVVKMPVRRAHGQVKATFVMQYADDKSHWASSMLLPTPLRYRIVHKGLGLPVFSAVVPAEATHKYHGMLPTESLLFVGET